MFTVECFFFFCPDGITPNSGLTGPNNTPIYIYIYIYSHEKCRYYTNTRLFKNSNKSMKFLQMIFM